MITDVGKQGFAWFIGVVEDRDDPLQLGRIKVRIYNMHSFKESDITTDDLPWASVIMPVTSAGSNGVGVSPTGIIVGSTVVGFFMDGLDGQLPVILGTIAGIPEEHDVPKRARGIDDKAQQISSNRIGNEPATSYAAKYPYNKVIQTESGHILEIDDTPSKERINIFHKSGSYTEINSDGRRVQKIVGDDFEIVKENKNVFIKGNLNINIEGSASINVSRTCSIKSTLPLLLDSTTAIIMSAPFVSIKGSQVASLQGGVVGLNTEFGDMFGQGDSGYTSTLQDTTSTIASDNAMEVAETFDADMSSLEDVFENTQTNILDDDTIQELTTRWATPELTPLENIKSNISSIYKNAANTVISQVGPIIKEGSKYGVTLESVSRVIANPAEGTKNIVLGNVSKFSNVLPDAPELATIKNAADSEYVQTALRVVVRAGGDPKQFIAACSAEVQQAAMDGLNTLVKAEMPTAVAREVVVPESANLTKVSVAFSDTVNAITQTTAEAINKMYGVSETAKLYFAEQVPDQYKRFTNVEAG